MAIADKREQAFQSLVDMFQISPVQVEVRAKKKPAGIKIIFEVTQEQMEGIVKRFL